MDNSDKKKEFTDIYEREADAIYRYALLRVSDKEEVTDIVQDTFARLWQKLSDGVIIEYPRSFIFTVARNRIIDWYRKKKTSSLEAATDDEESGALDIEIADESIQGSIELRAESSVVLKAMNSLPPQYREVIYLRFVEDLQPAEIASVMDMSPNAVSVRINRGLQELRSILGIETFKRPSTKYER